MDELELRRRLLADPNSDEQDLLDAIKEESHNQKLSDELKALDTRIANALDVNVPDNLANKLILKQSLHSHQQTKRRSKWHMAIAASVALVVGLGVSLVNLSPAHTNIVDYSIAHYHHEEGDFPKHAQAQISLASVNDKLGDLNVQFANAIGNLISIDDCYYDGMDSMHLVFEGKYDNITLFIIPKNEHLSFTEQFSEANIHGITKQYKNADVIIMGDKREQLNEWQQKVDSNIEFSI